MIHRLAIVLPIVDWFPAYPGEWLRFGILAVILPAALAIPKKQENYGYSTIFTTNLSHISRPKIFRTMSSENLC